MKSCFESLVRFLGEIYLRFCFLYFLPTLMMFYILYVQAFNKHKGAVTGLMFRQGTQQLMSCSLDRYIKLWSVEDHSYIDTLYGYQSNIMAIDCLCQEHILSAGRDRTLRLWKVSFHAIIKTYSYV